MHILRISVLLNKLLAYIYHTRTSYIDVNNNAKIALCKYDRLGGEVNSAMIFENVTKRAIYAKIAYIAFYF